MRKKYYCPGCGTSIDLGADECPECGMDLEWNVYPREEDEAQGLVRKVSDLESMLSEFKGDEEIDVEQKMEQSREMIANVEKLVYWAERYDLETQRMQELLSKGKEELEVGDWEEAMRYAELSMNTVIDPLREGARSGIRRARRDLRKAQESGRDVSQLKETIDEAERALNEKDIQESIELLHQYQEYSVDNISDSENEG